MTKAPLRAGPLADLLADLSRVMTGPLARVSGGLVGPEDPRSGLGVDRLLDTEMLIAIAAPFVARGFKPDRRALVSIWALTYFEAMLPPLLSANILLDREPHLALGEVSFILAPTRGIVALKLARNELLTEVLRTQTGEHRFLGLVNGHLAPFIDHAARRGGTTRRVLWSNAGHIFEAFLSMIGGIAAGRPGLADAHSLLARPTLPWGGENQLYQSVRYVGGRRLRRVCCLRLLIPEWRICAICPAKPRPRRSPI